MSEREKERECLGQHLNLVLPNVDARINKQRVHNNANELARRTMWRLRWVPSI